MYSVKHGLFSFRLNIVMHKTISAIFTFRIYSNKMSQRTIKPTIIPVWPTKTQISLYIHPVWQGFSFIPRWIAGRHMRSANSDQTTFFLWSWWWLPAGLLFLLLRYYFLPLPFRRVVSRSILGNGGAMPRWSPSRSCRCGAHGHVERIIRHLGIWRGRRHLGLRHLGCHTTGHTISCWDDRLLLLLVASPLCGLAW